MKEYSMIGVKNHVLDHGFIRLVDYMGDDDRVVQAARVSYDRDYADHGEIQDYNLIDFMMAEGHKSPFEHVQFTLEIQMPIFVARQWMR